jgi:hypothetical protein
MSEEQPVFKITDRRLFNPDGSPRDTEFRSEQNADETPLSTAAPSAAPQNFAAEAPSTPEADAADDAFAAAPAEGDFDEGEMAGPYDDDPASFTNFLMSLASNAAASLGLMEHPATGLRSVDLPLAKHWIDTLGMLQEKTRGNLTPQERQIMEGLLTDMRMQYVSLTTGGSTPRGGGGPAGGGARRFSGRDITGGR